MDKESLDNMMKWSMKLYDSMEPLREILDKNPELREFAIQALSQSMNSVFYDDWLGPIHLLDK